MLYYNNPSCDAAFNLALEERLMQNCPPGECIFSLWQSDRAVLVGRWQNTLSQIHAEYVRSEKIPVVRRITGGGAVYQDLGNVNYSFIRRGQKTDADFKKMTRIIIEALGKFGVNAEFNSRNDITVNGCKISGNAVNIHGGVVLHHGTLLLCSDFEQMEKTLNVNKEKLASKGVKSVSARVGNLVDFLPRPLSMAQFREKILACVLEGEEIAGPLALSPADIQAAEALAESKYRRWEWNYGESPDYNRILSKRLPCGQVELYIKSAPNGVIEKIKIFGDFFGEGRLAEIEKALEGAEMEPNAVLKRLAGLDIAGQLNGAQASDVAAMFADEKTVPLSKGKKAE